MTTARTISAQPPERMDIATLMRPENTEVHRTLLQVANEVGQALTDLLPGNESLGEAAIAFMQAVDRAIEGEASEVSTRQFELVLAWLKRVGQERQALAFWQRWLDRIVQVRIYDACTSAAELFATMKDARRRGIWMTLSDFERLFRMIESDMETRDSESLKPLLEELKEITDARTSDADGGDAAVDYGVKFGNDEHYRATLLAERLTSRDALQASSAA